jgi:Glyoxalase-like domain
MFSRMATSVQVVFDCADPPAMATFWAAALGYRLEGPPQPSPRWEAWLAEHQIPADHRDDASAITDPEAKGPRIYFQRVPEHKTVKNRVHLDLNVGGSAEVPLIQRRTKVDKEAERLAQAGATFVRAFSEHGEYCITMLDPEGNEFDLQ